MPQINLLSTGQKKKEPKENRASLLSRSSSLSSPFSQSTKPEIAQVIRPAAIRSSVCLVIGLIVWVALSIGIAGKEKVLKGLNEKTKVLETNPKEIERVQSERSALDKKVKLIDELSSRKFLWHEKLNQVGSVIPSGIWFTEITSSKASSRDLSSGVGEKIFFIMRGVAVAYKIDDAITLVGDYIKKLQAYEDFSKDFSEIKLNDINKSTIGGLDVMRFEILCESR